MRIYKVTIDFIGRNSFPESGCSDPWSNNYQCFIEHPEWRTGTFLVSANSTENAERLAFDCGLAKEWNEGFVYHDYLNAEPVRIELLGDSPEQTVEEVLGEEFGPTYPGEYSIKKIDL